MALVAASALAAAVAVERAMGAERQASTRVRLAAPGGQAPGPEVPAWVAAIVIWVGWPEDRATELWTGARWLVAPAAISLLLIAPVVGALSLAGGAALAVGAVGQSDRREASRREADLAPLVDHLISSLRSGASLAQAFESGAVRPGPLAADLSAVLQHQRGGAALQVAVDAWARDLPLGGVRLVADALGLAGGAGGSQAQALVGVRSSLRERQALGREVRALAAQARLSAAMLVTVPVGFAALMAALDPRIEAFLVGSPGGWGCIAGGLALDGAGSWWMRRLVQAAGR